jgi:hypothetical protein
MLLSASVVGFTTAEEQVLDADAAGDGEVGPERTIRSFATVMLSYRSIFERFTILTCPVELATATPLKASGRTAVQWSPPSVVRHKVLVPVFESQNWPHPMLAVTN